VALALRRFVVGWPATRVPEKAIMVTATAIAIVSTIGQLHPTRPSR